MSTRFVLSCALSLALFLPGCAKNIPPQSEPLELVLLHTNDTHSYVAGRDKYGNACIASADCAGGTGRIAAVVREERRQADNVLALDAGDQFQGTLFFTVNGWSMLADLDNRVNYDAVTLGNHEFDKGCDTLAQYVGALKYPVLAANLAPEPGCPLRGLSISPYAVRTVRGVKVGIVGLANPDVSTLAAACPYTRFTNSADALGKAVAELERQGVRHIVAVTHLGLPADRELARTVDGVDVIVGGHTHSYLGPNSPEGPYPVVEHSPSGQPVLVVTANFATEYLGELRVTFDAQGVPARWEGAAKRLEPGIVPAPDVEAKVADYAKPLKTFRAQTLGRNDLVFPDGMEACRKGECLGGLVVTDAMLDYGRPYGATLALTNGGSLRAPLKRGQFTQGDLLSMLPFGNMLVIREYDGGALLAALEHGISEAQGEGPRILHFAGLRYRFDAARPAGQRVLSAEVVDERGKARPLDKAERYAVVLPSYIAKGGDGYTMLTHGKTLPAPDPMDADVVGAYIKAHSPLSMPLTGRITKVSR